MKFSQKKLLLIIAGSLATTPAFSADLDYFVGADVGVRLDGDLEISRNGQEQKEEMSTSAVLGFHGGFVYDDSHRVTVGLDYRGLNDDDKDSDSDRQVTTLFTKYDYMLPIKNDLYWTVGTKLGYQRQDGEDKIKDLNGGIVGVQTGLDFAFDSWKLGTEVAYLHHLEEAKGFNGDGEEVKFNIGDEVLVMFTFNYYF
ncbi:hypothetical protein [Algicola sagamiensis]|uniref:hypothetical protein n=1 Tax=Algicola sagamiensis TaxID=163869 RepID=UPI0003A44B15|nr:hypothetical protein [Algicola sagamiensis]